MDGEQPADDHGRRARCDRQSPYYIEGKRDPILTDFFQQETFPQTTLVTRNSVAPRIGVSLDPAGNGKTAIKGFYGRYYFNFADSFSSVDPGGANYGTTCSTT